LYGYNILHVSCSVSSNGGHTFVLVKEGMHMAAPLPHACIGTPP
jgi:hypothetical protein